MSVDILYRMGLLLEGLFEDAKQSKNTILFNYDLSYPRVFTTDMLPILKACEYLNKYLLFNQENCRILFEFHLTNYTRDHVLFDIILSPSNPIQSSFDDKYLNLAKRQLKSNGLELKISKEGITISTKLNMQNKARRENFMPVPENVLKKYHALISYPDIKGFEILKNQLEYLGINVRPTNDYLSAHAHISNPIYTPNLVFINKDDIMSEQDKKDIIKAQKIKGFSIIIICENDTNIKGLDDFIILRQPYTYDTLYAIIAESYLRSLKN